MDFVDLKRTQAFIWPCDFGMTFCLRQSLRGPWKDGGGVNTKVDKEGNIKEWTRHSIQGLLPTTQDMPNWQDLTTTASSHLFPMMTCTDEPA